MQATLKHISTDPRADRNMALGIFKESFASQRLEINSGCGISKFLDDWPINREYDFLIRHFILLTNIEETDCALAFRTKLVKLRNFLDQNGKSLVVSAGPIEAIVIFKLAAHFKENANTLLVQYQVRKCNFFNSNKCLMNPF